MAIVDRIKYDGNASTDWLIYKSPIENIALGSQLIVGIGQEAVFIKGGKAQDIFMPGTYTLESGNLPLLRKLINFPFGGSTPFTAEIVYVNMTSNFDLKWGTSSSINVEDPKYGILLGLRSFGRFGMKVRDSRLLLNQLVGTMQLDTGYNNELLIEQFLSLINTKIKSLLMAFVREKKVSFLEIAEYYQMLSKKALIVLRKDFSDYGIELENFFIESISPPREQFEKLRQYKEELALGDNFYSKRRSFDVLEGLAKSPVGGMVGAGIGLGTGFMTANSANGPFEQISRNIQAETTRTPVADKAPCPSCQKLIPPDSKFCCYCGQGIPQFKFCSYCGQKLDNDAVFCKSCGKRCD
ncbi:MAG: SPFH domain-containing protein [Acidaminococcaceae bacterium]|nr:SPFH domain-containing protein [Acidaminococcaceae bacterium]